MIRSEKLNGSTFMLFKHGNTPAGRVVVSEDPPRFLQDQFRWDSAADLRAIADEMERLAKEADRG